MTPVLLDQRTLLKAGVTVGIGMLAVFFCGYYFGLQQSVGGDAMELNQTIALALPRRAHAETAAYEPRQPLSQAPGADIDVDSPGITAQETSDAETDSLSGDTGSGVDAAIRQTTDIIATVEPGNSTEQADRQLQLASLTGMPVVPDAGTGSARQGGDADAGTDHAVQQQAVAAEPIDPAGIVNTAGAEDARYTIQVGAFADVNNAMRRRSELESLQLSAYINEYTNRQDQQRYNVRFGYFSDKTSALAALDIFENSLSGTGYVTRIRRKIDR